MTIKKYIFLHTLKRIRILLFFVVVLVSPDFRLRTFIFSTSVGRGETGTKRSKSNFLEVAGRL